MKLPHVPHAIDDDLAAATVKGCVSDSPCCILSELIVWHWQQSDGRRIILLVSIQQQRYLHLLHAELPRAQ
jgi:hypothetical protein